MAAWLAANWHWVGIAGALVGGALMALVGQLRLAFARRQITEQKKQLAQTTVELEQQKMALAQQQAKAQVQGASDVDALRMFNAGGGVAAKPPAGGKQ